MTLAAAWTQLDAELNLLSGELRTFAAKRSPLDASHRFTLLDECMLEGLLSRVWQAWGIFARTCVVGSCVGTVSTAGNVIAALPDALSDAHVSGAAIRVKNKANPPYWGAPNSVLRWEPTWGDVDVLTRVLVGLKPTNHQQMLAAFSSSHASAKALQVIRNGSAHNHSQNMADIMGLRSAYRVFPINHPTQALFWLEPNTSDFLVTYAIQELRDAGLAAIA
ncbi:hypothetical protein [Bradyrhizobium valentinum]|uniref:Uncharacterized protein n=1 Tax=Bradyrhizobium valentinum TaxID=1518501 RepID=A0A0R3M3W2_9BRAD|nr:hypothetical protein [Bradyrhizobium valentinum]KRR14994.1 hypothetical protein CP49_23570 [Bradyrhizobium valentinum]